MVFFNDAGFQKVIRSRVDFYLTNLPTFDAHAGGTAKSDFALDRRTAELTTFFTIFSFNLAMSDISFAASWDAALEAGTKDFCLIQNCGHIFYGYDNLSVAMKDVFEQCEFLMGHIMDRGGYFYLHDQCVLVNRRSWERLGKPQFGMPANEKKHVAIPRRSAENVHDNYTPLYLEPTGQHLELQAMFGYGSNAISAGLAGGCRTVNWPQNLRALKRNCYAYYGDVPEWIKALSDVTAVDTQDPQLEGILRFLRNTPDKEDAPKKIFVFNSETDLDIPLLRFNPGIDRAFVLASGFKTNRLLESLSFHAGTEVIVYDYSQPALALRRMLVEEWDGRDYGSFFMSARPRLEAMFSETVTFLPEKLTNDAASVQQEFRREMGLVFTSDQQWLAHWQKYKLLPHTYVEVDVLQNPEATKNMLATHAKGHSVIWLSDMFNSPNAVGKFGWEYRKKAFAGVMDTLNAVTDSYLVIGTEPRLWLI